MKRTLMSCTISIAILAGCNTRPLPRDIARVSTFDIVQKIRCEAREVIRQNVLALFETEKTKGLLDEINRGERRLEDVKSDDILDKDVKRRFQKYRGATVALNFTFEISENNSNSANISLTDTFSGGEVLSVGAGSSGVLDRKNVRTFLTSDQFHELFDKEVLPAEYCATEIPDNGLYPVSGEIGLEEVFDTFFRLEEFGGLAAEGKKAAGIFNDTLTFTTTLSAGVKPKLTLTPGVLVASIDGDFSSMRKDVHIVRLTLAAPFFKTKSQRKAEAQKAEDEAVDKANRMAMRLLPQRVEIAGSVNVVSRDGTQELLSTTPSIPDIPNIATPGVRTLETPERVMADTFDENLKFADAPKAGSVEAEAVSDAEDAALARSGELERLRILGDAFRRNLIESGF